jgi:hypothetical protein
VSLNSNFYSFTCGFLTFTTVRRVLDILEESEEEAKKIMPSLTITNITGEEILDDSVDDRSETVQKATPHVSVVPETDRAKRIAKAFLDLKGYPRLTPGLDSVTARSDLLFKLLPAIPEYEAMKATFLYLVFFLARCTTASPDEALRVRIFKVWQFLILQII